MNGEINVNRTRSTAHGEYDATVLLLEICPRGNNKMVIIIFPCSWQLSIVHAIIVLFGNRNTCVKT